jgi:lysozyme family protein
MLQRGCIGLEVAAWQKVIGVTPDGDFGAKTDAATRAWQAAHGLTADGVVGAKTLAAAGLPVPPAPTPTANPDGLPFEFIQARCFRVASRSKIDRVHIHTTEGHERTGQARIVATMFHLPSTPEASAHFVVDSLETLQLVREKDIAWDAGGASLGGISIEHTGKAAQTPEEWADEYSLAVLERSAQLAASICRRHGIPIVHLTVEQIAAGGRGICGHVELQAAFAHGAGHVDPGKFFPWSDYIARVAAIAAELDAGHERVGA